MNAPHRTFLLAAMLVLLVLAGCEKKNVAPPPPPPPAVTVAPPLRKAVSVYGEYVGQLASPQTVELRARVDGFVKEINFKDGSEVKAGALLFVIDPAPFELALQRAKAQLQNSEAVLEQAKDTKQIEVNRANVQKSEAVFANMVQQKRDKEVAFKAGAMAREALDTAESNEKQAAAELASNRAALNQAESDYKHAISRAQAAIAIDHAAVANAELNLSYTKVYAPSDKADPDKTFLIGRSEVKLGSLVQQNQATLLATVWDINPMWVYFSVSEREAISLTKNRVKQPSGDGIRALNSKVEMILEDGSLYPEKGAYDFASPTYDMSTGTLTLRAKFLNPLKNLRPGNYAKVRMLLAERPNALLVTERAIGTDQSGKYLLVVNEKNIVERRVVKLGERLNGMIEVSEGLTGDERVVVNGIQRARPGSAVDPKSPEAAPTKDNSGVTTGKGATKAGG
jgi:RND family efflux transporter MFP subunit